MSRQTKVCKLKLKKTERQRLEKLVSRGKHSARSIRRGQILLMLDQGKSPSEIAKDLGINRGTVYDTCNNYKTGGYENIIKEKPRSGAPKKISERAIAHITALACSTPPEGRCRWTLRLLADRIVELKYVDSISHNKVGQILKKMKSNPGRKNNGV